MNDYESLDQLNHWADEVNENSKANTIKFVVCAKSDNIDDDEVVSKQDGQDYARQINAEFFMTSAKENTGINKMFQKAAELCAKNMELRVDYDQTTMSKDDGNMISDINDLGASKKS